MILEWCVAGVRMWRFAQLYSRRLLLVLLCGWLRACKRFKVVSSEIGRPIFVHGCWVIRESFRADDPQVLVPGSELGRRVVQDLLHLLLQLKCRKRWPVIVRILRPRWIQLLTFIQSPFFARYQMFFFPYVQRRISRRMVLVTIVSTLFTIFCTVVVCIFTSCYH